MQNDRHSFIIRIWCESADNNQNKGITVWRGSIDHVGKHDRKYFCTIDGIPDLIRQSLGVEQTDALNFWDVMIDKLRSKKRG